MNRSFSLLVIALFAVELFAPFAFAASPVAVPIPAAQPTTQPTAQPTPVQTYRAPPQSPYNVPGVCELHEFSPDQTRLFWDQSFAFRGDQVNNLRGQALLDNRPSQQVVNVFNQQTPSPTQSVRLAFVMNALLLDATQKKDALKLLNKGENDFITNAEATILVNRFSKDATPLQGLFNPSSANTQQEGTEYQNYKVKLLNGKEVALSELDSLPEINRNACVLNGNQIEGKVSYIASLNRDVLLAGDLANPIKDKMRLNADTTDTYLRLNGANNIVVPKRYERYTVGIKKAMVADFILNSFETAYFLGSLKYMKKNKDKLKEIKTDKQQIVSQPIVQQQLGQPGAREAAILGSSLTITEDLFNHNLQGLRAAHTRQVPDPANPTNFINYIDPAIDARIASIESEISTATARIRAGGGSSQEITEKVNKEMGEIYKRNQDAINHDLGGIQTDEAIIEIERTRQRNELNQKETILQREAETDLSDVKYEATEKKLRTFSGRLTYRFVMGYAWLGPGRFAMEMADAYNFRTIGGKSFRDNYVIVYANHKDLLKEFRDASSWALSGSLYDLMAKMTESGIPPEAFQTGNVLLFNSPSESQSNSKLEAAASQTQIRAGNSQWSIVSKWDGNSDAAFFDDVRGKTHAGLALEFKEQNWNLALQRKDELSDYYEVIKLIGPLLAWRVLTQVDVGERLVLVGRIFAYDYFINGFVAPNAVKPNEKCTDQKVDEWISYYNWATAATHTVYIAGIAAPWLKATTEGFAIMKGISKVGKVIPKSASTVLDIGFNTLDPATLAQGYAASQGFEYVSNCKDDQATIVTYQSLAKKEGNSLSENLKSISSTDLTSKLNVGKAALSLGNKVNTANLDEFVNLLVQLQNQRGVLSAGDIYYVHVDSMNQQWWDQNIDGAPGSNACIPRKCLDSDKSAACYGKDGVEICDKASGKCVKLANERRGLNQKEFDNLASVMIPNKYITTNIASCGSGPIFQVDYNSNLAFGGNCAGIQCLQSQLAYLTGRQVGNDLTTIMGKVTSVQTNAGTVNAAGGILRFYNNTVSVDDESEVRTVNPETFNGAATPSDEQNLKSVGKVSVLGDGRVVMSGYLDAQGTSDKEIGELRTIFTERGRINYLGNGQIEVFLHVFAQIDASAIKTIATSPVQCTIDGLQHIKIDRVIGQPVIGDGPAAEMNAALKKIQGDCGLPVLENEAHKYTFTRDANGDPVLRVLDKATGQTTDYKITGPIRQEGNDLIVPTDKGEFRFNIGMDENGRPMLGVTGPDGLRELLPLLGANGYGGALRYDPATGQWYAINGQNLPMNPDFAKNGQSITGGNDGSVRGNPTANLLAPLPATRGSSNGLASLPSWPSDPSAIVALIALILVGVAFVRRRK